MSGTYRKGHHREETQKFRGIFHEHICIVTTTDRDAHEIFFAVSQPQSIKDIIQSTFIYNFTQRTIIYTSERIVIPLYQNVRIVK